MKHLLIIDDEPIRKSAFLRAEKLIQKIDRLEHDLNSFHKYDQLLFQSWFEVTFRKEQERISERRDELRAMAKRHNWMIALAQIYNLSYAAALAFLRKEEAEYAHGSESIRSEIDTDRAERDRSIRDEIEKESASRAEIESDDFDELYRDDDNNDDDDERDDAGRTLTLEQSDRLQEIRQMSDHAICTLCESYDDTFALLKTLLALLKFREAQAILVRVWALVPRKNQVAFTKDFARQTGLQFNRFMMELKGRLTAAASDSQQQSGPASHGPSESQPFKKTLPYDPEATKFLYRRLVRLLHPDLQVDQQGQGHWQKQIWHRVQTAYARDDRTALEKIHRLVLIRAKSLSELSVSEILESQSWLQDELDTMADEAKDLRRQPSWGFAKKTTYDNLKRKLAKPLQAEIDEIEQEINEIRAQHAYLEMMGEDDDDRRRGRGRTRRRRTSKKSSTRRSRR